MDFTNQKSLNSYVAMIMVNLPFPPLPVQGASVEGDSRIVSGHDLLSRAIASTIVGPQISGTDVSTRVAERKQNLLRSMHERIAAVWGDKELGLDCRVEECYKHFCTVFRAYMRLYPGPDDLRILPMHDVDNKSIICSQAVRHLQARGLSALEVASSETDFASLMDCIEPGSGFALEQAPESVAQAAPPRAVWDGMRYKDLIAAYAEDLHQVSL